MIKKKKLEIKTIILVSFNVIAFIALAFLYIYQIETFNNMYEGMSGHDIDLKLQLNTVGVLTTWFLNQCKLLLFSLLVYYIAKVTDKFISNKKEGKQENKD